jgi:hypothetical protein
MHIKYMVHNDEEVAKRTLGLPPRWTHARFLKELVYDFVFHGQLRRKLADKVLASLLTKDSSTRLFSVF